MTSVSSCSQATVTQAFVQALVAKGLTIDPDQKPVLGQFDRLHHELTRNDHLVPDPGFFGQLRRRLARKIHDSPRGIYLWGGVGRGKTMMMDVFHQSLAGPGTRRAHFHRFMLEIHQRLRQLRDQKNPLEQVSRAISRKTRLLCLDELFVEDIGDAMILGGLLRGLIDAGVCLAFTSNYRPTDLYRDGLQRDRFLPSIALIEKHTLVTHLGGQLDYRLELLGRSDVFYTPHDAATDQTFRRLFLQIASGSGEFDTSVSINDRLIPVRATAEGISWFDFTALCEGPRSKADYVELSRACHTVLLSNIPKLHSHQDDCVRRLVELIDEFYDRRVNVIVSAAGPPETLYTGSRMALPFNRSTSRLMAFQSADYIALPHRP
ncbi:MAG: cell division protein ZapE [Pseudomonadota bacterium]|nr:cell division protein ZapE [Pseudomonadota bacterium]MED5408465.1 cell division protein ZapE [Pseudomonadota bacterium]MEE3287194.1 cell division protein ZapE [Pseudomonadota bacterium]